MFGTGTGKQQSTSNVRTRVVARAVKRASKRLEEAGETPSSPPPTQFSKEMLDTAPEPPWHRKSGELPRAWSETEDDAIEPLSEEDRIGARGDRALVRGLGPERVYAQPRVDRVLRPLRLPPLGAAERLTRAIRPSRTLPTA